MAENFFDENIGQTPKYSFEDEGKILPKVTFEMKNGSQKKKTLFSKCLFLYFKD